jgi:anti-anti-sigma factor
MPFAVDVAVHPGGGYAVAEVLGDVDIATAARLGATLADAAADAPCLVLDLTGVTLLSAAGLRVVLHTADVLAERGAALHLVCGEGSVVAMVLRAARLYDRWPIHPSLAAAEHFLPGG